MPPDTSFTLTLTSIAHGGPALGRHEGKVIFVHYALPGETVRVEITDDRGRYAFARLLEVVAAAPERAEPPCPHFGLCGGCQWQHIAYAAQLRFKREIVADQLARLAGLRDVPVAETVASPAPWNYRNHARFVPVARPLPAEQRAETPGPENVPATETPVAPPGEGASGEPGAGAALGFHALQSHAVVPIRECHIIAPALAELYASLAVDPVEHRLIALELRTGVRTGDTLVAFETEDDVPPEIESNLPVSAALLLEDGTAATLVGDTAITEELGGRAFRISPASFFQANTEVAERLVATVLAELALEPAARVLDAYCGVGLFSAFIAPRCARLVGIEAGPSAVADFAANLDEFDNVAVYEGLVEDVLPALLAEGEAFDRVVLDPPRTGCTPDALAALVAARPGRIVYVSCDVATLARDLKRLVAAGYAVRAVQPFDMFPQTYHVEVVATLEATPG
jgi:23S rRNA (uracil1939-C5)-methyltransferase